MKRRELAQTLGRGAAGLAGAVLLFLAMRAFLPLPATLATAAAAMAAVLVAGVAIAWPQLQRGRSGSRIDDTMPFFITHFGILATSSMPRNDMLRVLAQSQEYHDIAGEIARILRLTEQWGLSLADAVRAVSRSTPSAIFSQFLLRLAHAIESGQALETFLQAEQGVVMHEYESLYQADLLRIENWKEMYTNTVMTVGFAAVFAAVIPMVTGGSVLALTISVAAVAVVLEVVLGMVLKERLPADRLRPNRPIRSKVETSIRLAMAAGAALALLAFAVVMRAGTGFALVAAAVPLALPGIVALREEASIRRREEDYPAFIRSLGAAASARGAGVRDVLGQVQSNNLGELAKPVQALHRRLQWRLDDPKSWRRFGEDTGSRLIDSFTDMFVEGIRAGGKPGPIGHIVSDNMVRIQALRTSRRATAGAFRGMLFGLTAGLALVLFFGSGIFDMLGTLFGDHVDLLREQGLVAIQSGLNVELARNVLFGVVAFHAGAAGLYYKLVEGGRTEAAFLYGSVHMAIGAVTGILVVRMVPRLFGAG